MRNKVAITGSQRERILRNLERILARKLQIKAQIASLHESAQGLTKEMIKKKSPLYSKKEKSSNKYRLTAIKQRETELYGELVEVSALTKSIHARRLKPLVNANNVWKMAGDASLMKARSDKDFKGAVTGYCVTSCKDCITSCTDCVTSCNSDCITHCTSDCITPCTVGDTIGCPHKTFGEQDSSGFNTKTLSNMNLKKMMTKKYGKNKINVDWN